MAVEGNRRASVSRHGAREIGDDDDDDDDGGLTWLMPDGIITSAYRLLGSTNSICIGLSTQRRHRQEDRTIVRI